MRDPSKAARAAPRVSGGDPQNVEQIANRLDTEDTAPACALQRRFLISRLRVSPYGAATIAELAFPARRAWP